MPQVQREIRRRGFVGKIFKWTFVIFNLLMLFWLVSYWFHLGELSQTTTTDAERAGAAIGGTIGTGMLVFFWMAGAVILGLLTMMTRGSKILITEEK